VVVVVLVVFVGVGIVGPAEAEIGAVVRIWTL